MVAGCGPKVPLIVEVDRPVFIEPPASCLVPVLWDDEADPATNGELLASWDARGMALEIAASHAECVRGWAADMAATLRAKGPPRVAGVPGG